MSNFLIKWIINIFSLFVVIHIIAGVSIDSWGSIVVSALVLGLLNAFLRPVIFALTLPFSVATLGFFTLIINGSMFYLASKFVKGFIVAGFWSAFWASILFSIISFILSIIFAPKTNFVYNGSGPEPRAEPKRYDDVIDVEGHVEDSKPGQE